MLNFLFAAYAETHYKFRLPWSPLHEPWPEIFLDAPCRVEPGHHWPMVLAVRDADLFPVHIHEIVCTLSAEDCDPFTWTIPLDLRLEGPFHFVPLTLDLGGRQGTIQLQARIDAERIGSKIPRVARKQIQEWNYPTLAPAPLQALVLAQPTPKPQGWWAGETHCHTWHSSDPVEFGAPALVLQNAARVLALDFALCTDHSYDFHFRNDDYRVPCDPEQRWCALQKEFAELPSYPLMVPGEEVSCGNARGQNVHLLVAGHGDFIPGLGDSGRRWFHNRPQLSLAEVLERVGDLPCFGAHPQAPMSLLERLVFRRGDYHISDLHGELKNSLAGLEFWNGARDQGYEKGRAFWIQRLLEGYRLLPLGGNDAHGDMNRFTGVHLPLLSLRSQRARLFGRTRTVLAATGPLLNTAQLQEAFRQARTSGNLYATDGPSLVIDRSGGRCEISAQSSSDFGTIEEIRVYLGKVGSSCELMREHHGRGWQFTCKEQVLSGPAYVRAECRTSLGYQALTAAHWVE